MLLPAGNVKPCSGTVLVALTAPAPHYSHTSFRLLSCPLLQFKSCRCPTVPKLYYKTSLGERTSPAQPHRRPLLCKLYRKPYNWNTNSLSRRSRADFVLRKQCHSYCYLEKNSAVCRHIGHVQHCNSRRNLDVQPRKAPSLPRLAVLHHYMLRWQHNSAPEIRAPE